MSPSSLSLGSVAMPTLPKVVAAILLSSLPANPRHLMRVGWSFVAADVTTLVLLVWQGR